MQKNRCYKGKYEKKTLISKYKSLLNFDTWGNDVLPKLNISSQIPDDNIRGKDYLNI